MQRNTTLDQYGESIFTSISRRAREHDAIDLGQGFPSVLPPEELRASLRDLPDEVKNHQYSPMNGVEKLRETLSRFYGDLYGLNYDADDEITITTGATEAIHAALLGMVNAGDEVIVFEPIYDQYVPVAERAGADVTVIPLEKDSYALPVDRLRNTVTDDTSLILINNPHNPTGTVFDRKGLRSLVTLAERHDVTLLSDEVYEHLIFKGADFTPIASIEGARERTMRFGSAGKTFDATGWKLGWALGPSDLTESLRLSHQFSTYSAATPMQVALTQFFDRIDIGEYFEAFREDYRRRRELLLTGLESTPFEAMDSAGTYFVLVRYTGSDFDSDRELVNWMIETIGVSAIPLSAFYETGSPSEPTLRMAFCKSESQLRAAVERLESFFGG